MSDSELEIITSDEGGDAEKNDALFELMLLVDTDYPSATDVTAKLVELARSVLQGGIEARDEVIARDAYAIVGRAWLYCCDNDEPGRTDCQNAVLEVLFALTLGNPLTMDYNGWQIIAEALDESQPEETHAVALKLLRNVFIKSEENREEFAQNVYLFEEFVAIILQPKIITSQVICEWCSAAKALLLCDDPRVPYNRAGERKHMMSKASILPRVTDFLNQKEFRQDSKMLNAAVLFLGSMAVSEETCLQMGWANVLQGVRSIFRNHFENKPLVRNATALLRLLCVCQTFRDKSASLALMKWTVDILDEYNTEADVVEEVISCCASMTTKNPCQVTQFIAKNGLQQLSKQMKAHSQEIGIMKAICITLRNVIENGGDNARNKMKEEGFETSLKEAISKSPGLEQLYVSPILQELKKAQSTAEPA